MLKQQLGRSRRWRASSRSSAARTSPTMRGLESSASSSGRSGLPTAPRRPPTALLRVSRTAKPLPKKLVHSPWVGLPAGLAHDLTHEEAEQSLLAGPICRHLARIPLEHAVDERLELRGVGDRRLVEVLGGREAG